MAKLKITITGFVPTPQMSLVCALTGEVPEEGVFCAETGLIYERRLIQKHLAARGCCPVTGVQLKADQLVPIKRKIRHREGKRRPSERKRET